MKGVTGNARGSQCRGGHEDISVGVGVKTGQVVGESRWAYGQCRRQRRWRH